MRILDTNYVALAIVPSWAKCRYIWRESPVAAIVDEQDIEYIKIEVLLYTAYEKRLPEAQYSEEAAPT